MCACQRTTYGSLLFPSCGAWDLTLAVRLGGTCLSELVVCELLICCVCFCGLCVSTCAWGLCVVKVSVSSQPGCRILSHGVCVVYRVWYMSVMCVMRGISEHAQTLYPHLGAPVVTNK